MGTPLRVVGARALLCLIATPSVLHAQGPDSCANPTSLGSSVGWVGFDNMSATTGAEGQTESACDFRGTTAITDDVWYSWTAPSAGTWRISLGCGSYADWKMAVYAGLGCPTAPAVACSDDGCQLLPDAVITAVAGQTFTLQIGNHVGQYHGFGTIYIQDVTLACAAAPGPDVVVAEITDLANHTGNGTIDAISMGFRAANIGQAPLAWNAATSDHPVFAQSLYSYRTSSLGYARYEQVGQSWVRHPDAVTNGPSYCACVPPGSGVALGAGCGEQYLAAVAGTQSALGPRWQVDATTGAFPYPPANPPWSGDLARRLEFTLEDVPAFQSFFGIAEVLAGARDDALAGAAGNNASWRQVGMTYEGTLSNAYLTTGGEYLTHVGEPALNAWRLFDPQVRIVEVAVPGGGRLLVGSRATPLGDGSTHYEYAVQNVDCSRGVGAFSVPIPAGVLAWNVGFHDVPYRDGDGPGDVNWSGTDWSSSISGGVLTWSTQTPAQDASANALRWSTTYNFRFDANASPGVGVADLGLWASGAPGSVQAFVDAPGASTNTFGFCYGHPPAACPCGNYDPSGLPRGCTHSLGYGASLSVSGSASVSGDTLRLSVGTAPYTTSCMFFQGTTMLNGGLGTSFGDGLRCVGGTLVRLGSTLTTFGNGSIPAAGGTRISVAGGVAPGDVRTYQVWYRNVAAFCTPEPFNLTNGYQILWAP